MILRLCLAASCLLAAPAFADYSAHPAAQRLVDELAGQAGYTREELRSILREARRNPELIKSEQTAAEKTLTWPRYREIFLDSGRIAGGDAFLDQHAEHFARAEALYGVPPRFIAAIIGVETRYGGYTGPHRVLDSLATQGFEHPTRSEFFFKEFKEFLLACREFELDPLSVTGSYAGAMGLPQFMPSNYRRLAVDHDGDGRIDLWTPGDAIGSAANYLLRYRGEELGWKRGWPIAVPLGTGIDGLRNNEKSASYRYAELVARGLAIAHNPPPPDVPVGLIALETGAEPETWLAFPNFYSLLSYNPRPFYAMAVFQLAEAIAQAREPLP